MRLRTRALTFLAAGSLLLAACGEDVEETDDALLEEDAGDATTDEDADAAEEEADTVEPDVAVADSSLGAHLVDGEGFTLYLFDNDAPGVSNCTGDCLANWPPLTVEDTPVAGEGVDGDLLGTIEREDDGTVQVTYDGQPLYFWAADTAPGDVDGQGVNDVWWVVAPDGSAITEQVDGGMEDDGY